MAPVREGKAGRSFPLLQEDLDQDGSYLISET